MCSYQIHKVNIIDSNIYGKYSDKTYKNEYREVKINNEILQQYNALLENHNCYYKLGIENEKKFFYLENEEASYLPNVTLSFNLDCKDNKELNVRLESFSRNPDTLNNMRHNVVLSYFSKFDLSLISKYYLKKQTKNEFYNQLSDPFFKSFSSDVLIAIKQNIKNINEKEKKLDSWK
jgi:hypothetical protein